MKYSEHMDESTNFDCIIRITDADGNLVEDVHLFEVDRHAREMISASRDSVKAAMRCLRDCEEAYQKTLYLATQNVWSKRGGNNA